MQRSKINILKAYYGWMDAEISMIWDFEEWIEIMAVYGEWTFPPLCWAANWVKRNWLQICILDICRIVPCL